MATLLMQKSQSTPTPTLLVFITHIKSEIRQDDIRTVFRNYKRRYRFPALEPSKCTVLFDYESEQEAIAVREHTNGRCMLQGQALLAVQFFPITVMEAVETDLPAAYCAASLEAEKMTPSPRPNSTLPPAQRPRVGGFQPHPRLVHGCTTIVEVENVPNDVPIDHVFVLCGLYGDVLRVRRLPCAPPEAPTSTLLVQFNSATQALKAVDQLQRCPFFGSTLTLRLHIPTQDTTNTALSAAANPKETSTTEFEYTTTPERYRYELSDAHPRLQKHISPPSRCLFVVNIDPDVEDISLVDFFTESGCRISTFQRNTQYTATVELGSVAAAVEAFVRLHDCEVQGRKVKLLFGNHGPEASW